MVEDRFKVERETEIQLTIYDRLPNHTPVPISDSLEVINFLFVRQTLG